MKSYLGICGREEVQIRGNGLCFLNAINECLHKDFNDTNTSETIINLLVNEVMDRSAHYKNFHTGDTEVVLRDVVSFLHDRLYTTDIMDIVVAAASDALKVWSVFNLSFMTLH